MKKHLYSCLAIVFVYLLLLSLLPAVHTDAASTWLFYTVERFAGGTESALALDSNGNPHIAYRDPEFNDLKYAKWNGTQWNIELVDSQGKCGYSPILVLDSSGNPHIIYQDNTNYILKYAKWSGTQWNIVTVEDANSCYSFVLDSDGTPCICYDKGYYGLKYAKWTGSEWNITTVDSNFQFPWYASLALDIGGNPHISYYNVQGAIENEYYCLKYASLNDTGWSVETVDFKGGWFLGGSLFLSTSLAMDSNGNPHIAYSHDAIQNGSHQNGLKYASWNGTGWNIETVDSGLKQSASLFLDSSGTPYIFFHYYGWDNSNYFKWTGSEWIVEILGGGVQSFVLDSSDNPHITLYDEALKYASIVPLPTPTPTPAPTPEATPTPTSASSPSPTTPTPTPTPSPSPTPTQPPTTGVPPEIIYSIAAVAIVAIAATAAVIIKKQK
jgi:hypothetical protein